MGCGCGKNKGSNPDSARASANLKKVQEKRMEPPINRPTFPQIPQLTEPRVRRNLMLPDSEERFVSHDEMKERVSQGLSPTGSDAGVPFSSIEKLEDSVESKPIKTPSFTEKVKNLGKSVASRVTQGKANEKLIKLRHISCHGDEEVVPCPYRSASNTREGAYFCTACGCGDKPRAFLNDPDDSGAYTKLDYPWVSCPVRMPGFGDYKPFSEETQEAIDKLPNGMKRKQLTEVVLTARGIEIPSAYEPVKTNGDTNDSSES